MLVSALGLRLCLDLGLFLNTGLARLIAQALRLPPAAFCSTTMSARSLPTALAFYRDTQMSSFPCDWRLLAPLNMQGGEAERTRTRGRGGYTHSLLSHTLLVPKAFGPRSSEPVHVKSGSRSLHFPFHRCRVVNGEQCRIELMSFLQRLC